MKRRTLLAAAGLTGLGLATATTAPQTARAATRGGWTPTPIGRPTTLLNDVSDHGAQWAVGSVLVDSYVDQRPLILRRAGTRWHAVRQPVSANGSLVSVAVVSANEAWAVGSLAGDGIETSPLVMRWDGSSWRAVHPPLAIGAFADVAVGSDGSIWVAGWGRIGTSEHAVAYRFSGGRWHAVLSGLDGYINGNALLVRSPRDVWLATNPGMAHFDGRAWTAAAGLPADGSQILTGMAMAQGRLWGAGVQYTGDNGQRALVVTYDGGRWRRVAGPDTSAQLASVTAYGKHVVAVGERIIDTPDTRYTVPYVLKLTGQHFAAATPPALPKGALAGGLTGVATTADRLWTVGYSQLDLATDPAAYAAYEPR